jgi:hypothetical protein
MELQSLLPCLQEPFTLPHSDHIAKPISLRPSVLPHFLSPKFCIHSNLSHSYYMLVHQILLNQPNNVKRSLSIMKVFTL